MKKMERILDGGASLISSGNFRETLINCEGLYECPVNELGQPLGPLVGYAGTYQVTESADSSEIQHYVGLAYYNFSMADQYPAVLRAFAKQLAENIKHAMDSPDVILGAPMAGIKLSAALAEELGCRHIFAEKKVLVLGQQGQRDEEELVLSRYDIHPGDRVLIGEELVNNVSSAQKLINLIEAAGGVYAGIACAINRSASGVGDYQGLPIIAVLDVPTPQYRQDDQLVQNALRRGWEIIWKPKPNWAKLKAAMDASSLNSMSDGDER